MPTPAITSTETMTAVHTALRLVRVTAPRPICAGLAVFVRATADLTTGLGGRELDVTLDLNHC
jgi:hypothetical protein